MKKPSLKQKLSYKFDNIMSKGAISLIWFLAIITLVVIIIAGVIISISDPETNGNVIQSTWMSLMHAIDAGTIAGDDPSNILFIVTMSIVTICGLFITSMLIGVISTGLEAKMEDLRKGHSLVLEKNHVIILGFNENAINIIRELIIANENQKKGVIVVMDNQDKTEMEDLIAQRISDTKNTKIICRSGNIDNISDVEICSPETCRSIIVNAENDFMSVKAVLASATILENSDNQKAYITALIHSEENAEAARIAGNGKAEVFYYQSSIARIMAHTSRQPGMSTVFTSLLSYEGDEIYVEEISGLAGKNFGELNLLFPRSTVIGIVRDKKPILNPPSTTPINETDKIILIAEDDGISIPNFEKANVDNSKFADGKADEPVPQKTIIFGCNELLDQVITELDCYATKDSEIIIATTEESLNEEYLPAQENLENIKLTKDICDIFNRKELERIIAKNPNNVLILTNQNDDDETADSKTLLLLLQLRDISRKNNLHFTVTSEMRSIEDQELAEVTKVTDFVISSNITALMMTQISQTREQFVILDDLLSDSGSELYMKIANRYVVTDKPVNYYTVCASASRYGEIAIGYKKVKENGKFEIVINPPKEQEIIFNKDDRLIVVAEY